MDRNREELFARVRYSSSSDSDNPKKTAEPMSIKYLQNLTGGVLAMPGLLESEKLNCTQGSNCESRIEVCERIEKAAKLDMRDNPSDLKSRFC